MENYFYIDGKKTSMSRETADSILESQEKVTLEVILDSKKKGYYISNQNNINEITGNGDFLNYSCNQNVVATKQRAKQLQAIILLMNVADYFNEIAEFYAQEYGKYHYIEYNGNNKKFEVSTTYGYNRGNIFFEKKEHAEQAIEILGEETIKLALIGH